MSSKSLLINCNQIACRASRGGENENICSNRPDHMTNMTAMPIYGENL